MAPAHPRMPQIVSARDSTTHSQAPILRPMRVDPGSPPRAIRMLRIGLASVMVFLTALDGAAQSPADPEERGRIQRMVFSGFPDANAYSRIERKIDREARAAIEKALPFRVHFNELGKHTVFVAFRGRRPLGLVYTRNEESEWGLTEIGWHLSLDLQVVGFEFVRSRSLHRERLMRSAFPASIQGQSLERIAARLHGKNLKAREVPPKGTEELANTVLRSAAKALVVTGVVWRREIEKLRDQAIGFRKFPAATRFIRRTGTFTIEAGPTDVGVKQQTSAKVLYAYNADRILIGIIAWTADLPNEAHELEWICDRNLYLLGLRATDRDAPTEIRKACASFAGRSLADPGDKNHSLTPRARALATVIRSLDRERSLVR